MAGNTYKVLLIEDDRIDQMAFRKMMESNALSYEYKIVDSANDAKALLQHTRFDVIITDYMLGDGTAFDFLRHLQDTPVIITTGAGNEEIAVMALREGAFDYLIKDVKGSYLKVLPVTIDNAVRRMRYQKQLRMLSHAVMSIGESVYITDIQNKLLFVNKAFVETFGYSEAEIAGKDSEIILQRVCETSEGARICDGLEEAYNNEAYYAKKDGTVFPVLASNSYVTDEDGNKLAKVGVIRDISEIRSVQEKLQVFATTDILTGALNRRAGLVILEKQVQAAKRSGEPFTICYVDVDGLKIVNDVYGHQVGDELITATSAVIREIIRESDTLCRLGGDEFLIILPECSLHQAAIVWERVLERIRQYNTGVQRPYSLGLSCGFAEYLPQEDCKVDALIAKADKEMYKNKKTVHGQLNEIFLEKD